MAKKSVLFICLGNICRSPIAEAVFTDLVKKKGLAEKWVIHSGGVQGWHAGEDPDPRGRQCLQTHNIQTSHKGYQIRKEDFTKYDFILGMDEDNMTDLRRIEPSGSTAKVALLGSYDPKGQKIIEDPYYGGDEGFEVVYQQCVRCCTAFLEQHS